LGVSLTELLHRWRTGDADAAEALASQVEVELRRIAARQLRGEANRSLLQTSALVNEAYLRLAEHPPAARDRAHFFSIAARVMRHILVDAARARRRAKREGLRVSLSDAGPAASRSVADVLLLNEALDRLANFDARKAQVVEMRFFAGMEVEEVAEFLGVSPNTVIRDWSIARAWLQKELR
jgi:RNA polymerase sigma factor (TIGR02999 family)